MEITYLGHSSFKIRGKGATLVTDPYLSSAVGFAFPKIEADIVTVSHDHQDHNNWKQVDGAPLVISGPGEYEAKNIKIIGISTFHDSEKGKIRGKSTIYFMEIDGVTLLHLGDLGHQLEDREIELVNGVNIVMIPVGGIYTIDVQVAHKVISQVEPNIIIPMHYKTDKHNPSVFDKLTDLNAFLKEMGRENISAVPKLNITRDKIPSELTIVVLS